MSDLQEQLARRLAELGFRDSDDYLLRMAAECIRQMEWAAKGEHDLWAPEMTLGEKSGRAPLTLAPDDWQP